MVHGTAKRVIRYLNDDASPTLIQHMSNSLSPWILEFLLDIAKGFGAKLYNVQPYPKKKKVQITEVS